jgi:hypothetical protein
MDPIRNPFAPGAGSEPPELAGRDAIIADANTALQRILLGRHDKSQVLLGLRGTGKTVLLNRIEQLAVDAGYETSFIKAPEDKPLAALLYPRMLQALRRFSVLETAKAASYKALRALRSFASSFDIAYGDFSISVDPEPGIADSRNLEFDLSDVFVRIGEAARSAGRGWALLIDEVQYLDDAALSALIVAIHKTNQSKLPVIFFGAGLPQLAGIAGEAKSYSERLFNYATIGPLSVPAARSAIREPIESEGESIDDEALALIITETEGFPYFLQEWGYQAWNVAETSPINTAHAKTATVNALKRLDDGFFRVRLDRLTPKEREYVFAMASLGKGPYKSSDVAAQLGEPMQKLGPRRAAIIRKGMIYSPEHGDIAFTVPMFDQFLDRMRQGADKANRVP